MHQFDNIYNNRRILVTGHTGFKGSWLCLWLKELGARVFGLARAPETQPNHWDLLGLDIEEERFDICDFSCLRAWLEKIRPELVFHLAAQSLVKKSYQNPLETWTTNVMGTVNLVEAARHIRETRAVLVVTTDKVYKNNEWPWGYREIDQLEGYDPYSASKAAAELVVNSYRNSFSGTSAGIPLIGTARGGNVIGGGDWAEDRLIPDLIRAMEAGKSLSIRHPGATRPWQHVLDCLSGYLLLGQKMLEGKREAADAWNFGPDQESNVQVVDMLRRIKDLWPEVSWQCDQGPVEHEANYLYLDSSKSRKLLGWQPVWSLQEALEATIEWYKSYRDSRLPASRQQLDKFLRAAARVKVNWIGK